MFQEQSFLHELKTDRFRDFAAHFSQLSEETSELLWKNKNGCMADSIRFLFSGKTLFITGDLGDAVLNFSERVTLPRAATFSPHYFVEKISCATDQYAFDEDDAVEDLETQVEDLIALMEEDGDREDDIQQLEEIQEMLKERFSRRDGFVNTASGEWVSALSEFDSECLEWLELSGRHIAPRVYMWLTALQLAYQQLQKA